MRHQVVYVMSTNFAGSTVLGLTVGSHPDALFLGEPSMIVRRDGALRWKHNNFCAICKGDWHERCPLWKPLLIAQVRESPRRIYDLLAAGSPQTRFFVDASKNLEWLNDAMRSGNVDAKVVHISKSVYRYAGSVLNRKRGLLPIEAIGLDWARDNEAIRLYSVRNGLPYMHVRYTDFVNNFDEVMRRLGLFIGFDFQTTQREFWKFPHHYVKGNPGTVTHFDPSRIEDLQGVNRKLYEQNHRKIFLDNKWLDVLSRRDLNRLISLPEVEAESDILGHELPANVRSSIATRLRGRIVARTLRTTQYLRSMFAGTPSRALKHPARSSE